MGRTASPVLILSRNLLVETRGMRHIGCFQLRAVFGGQSHREGRNRVTEVLRLCGANDGSSDSGAGEQPCKGDSRGGDAQTGGDGSDRSNDTLIRLFSLSVQQG